MIQNETSSFKAGMLFHSFVDDVREKCMVPNNVYSMIPHTIHSDAALKVFEDILIYEKIEDWNQIITFFDVVLCEERLCDIPENDIIKWHTFIKMYCGPKITPENCLALYLTLHYTFIPRIIVRLFACACIKLKLLPSKFKPIMQAIEQLTKNEKLKYIILNFYNNFEMIAMHQSKAC